MYFNMYECYVTGMTFFTSFARRIKFSLPSIKHCTKTANDKGGGCGGGGGGGGVGGGSSDVQHKFHMNYSGTELFGD